MAIGTSAMGALRDMVEELNRANEARDDSAEAEAALDDAVRAIHEDPLSIEILYRGAPHEEPTAMGFEMLLSTGGPAVRIVGELDLHGEPTRPRLEVQDWFLPWTEYPTSSDEDELLETYVAQFGQLAGEL